MSAAVELGWPVALLNAFLLFVKDSDTPVLSNLLRHLRRLPCDILSPLLGVQWVECGDSGHRGLIMGPTTSPHCILTERATAGQLQVHEQPEVEAEVQLESKVPAALFTMEGTGGGAQKGFEEVGAAAAPVVYIIDQQHSHEYAVAPKKVSTL